MTAKYAYAVARVRVKELFLLSRKEVEQLLACRTYTEALDFLKNRGFGSAAKDDTITDLLDAERAATWSFLREIVKDDPTLDLFLYENDFHNLKAAIKAHQAGIEPEGIFYPEGTVPQMHIWKATPMPSAHSKHFPRELSNISEPMPPKWTAWTPSALPPD